MDPKLKYCPICYREMIPGKSLEKHHFIPKSLGGRETITIHKICHQKLHSVFTEKELKKEYHESEKIRMHPEMITFIDWLQKKEPEYYSKVRKPFKKRR